MVYFGSCGSVADSDSLPDNMKTNSEKKADPEQNSAFNMYDIVFADLIDTFVLPNAVYLLTLVSIQISTPN